MTIMRRRAHVTTRFVAILSIVLTSPWAVRSSIPRALGAEWTADGSVYISIAPAQRKSHHLSPDADVILPKAAAKAITPKPTRQGLPKEGAKAITPKPTRQGLPKAAAKAITPKPTRQLAKRSTGMQAANCLCRLRISSTAAPLHRVVRA
jgi:hypothetical protein